MLKLKTLKLMPKEKCILGKSTTRQLLFLVKFSKWLFSINPYFKKQLRKETPLKSNISLLCWEVYSHCLKLKTNMETHMEEEAHSSILKILMQTQNGKFFFPTNAHGSGFSNDWCLRRHMQMPTGGKSFFCEICGSAFSEDSKLKTYM